MGKIGYEISQNTDVVILFDVKEGEPWARIYGPFKKGVNLIDCYKGIIDKLQKEIKTWESRL